MLWALEDAPVPSNEPYAHLVLIALADHASDDGTSARPSVALLATKARCSARTVHTKLRLLQDAGIIRRGDQEQVAHLRADRRPTVWDLAVNGVQQMQVAPTGEPVDNSGDGVQHVHPVARHGVKRTTSRGEAPGTHGVKRSADRTVHEPSMNQGGTNATTSPVDTGRQQPPPVNPTRERRDRCPDHQAIDIAPACGGCRDARLSAARSDAEAAVAARARNEDYERADRCPEHHGGRIGYCPGCAADHKAGDHRGQRSTSCADCVPAILRVGS